MSKRSWALVALSLASFSFANAQVDVSLDSAHSAAVGVSTWNGDQTVYGGSIFNHSGGDMYVNGVGFTASVGDWSGFTVSAGQSIVSQMGTPLADGSTLSGGTISSGLLSVAWNSGASGLTVGHYEGNVDILGGSTAGSTDILGSQLISLDVISDQTFGGTTYDITTPAQTTTPGGTSQFGTKVVAGNAPFFGWAVSYGTSDPALDHSNFTFDNWPGLSGMIAAGSTWENADSFAWTAANNTPPGTYHGRYGYMGGNDMWDVNYVFAKDYTWTVQAVPEPTSMAVLGLGILGLIRRRKSA